ncbi:hypothetical protein [Streptacidiphilus cavernicola]|uniref:Uncharacterized protein n=1 Tax=Streptacidiphilus cavernicola TaxID=3342716 RepID=A0ABV6VYI5_9ACTN
MDLVDGPRWPTVIRHTYTGEPDDPKSELPRGYDRYAGAVLVGGLLQAADLTPPEQSGPHSRDWCAVESIHPDEWPPQATACVRVAYYTAPKARTYEPDEEAELEAWHAGARRVADHLESLGWTTALLEHHGGKLHPVLRWVLVYRLDGEDRAGKWVPKDGADVAIPDMPQQLEDYDEAAGAPGEGSARSGEEQQVADAEALVARFGDDGEEGWLDLDEVEGPVCERIQWATDAEILLRRLPQQRQEAIEAVVAELARDPWESTVEHNSDRAVRLARPESGTELVVVVAGLLLVVAELRVDDPQARPTGGVS